MSESRQELYRELEIKCNVGVEGLNVDSTIFQNLELGSKYQEQIHRLSEYDKEHHVGIYFPVGFTSPRGFKISFHLDRHSPYAIHYENGKFYLTYKGAEVFPVEFLSRPAYYGQKTTDGTPMSRVAVYNREGAIIVGYSNECSLKEKSLDCLFCNVNATKDTYGEAEGIYRKTPGQVGETAAAAQREGKFKHITITGGFIPERREVDYYIDVAEAIKEYTGLKDFNGTGVIGAPLDLEVVDKYKEAGYRTIAMNLEVWDKHIYKAVCPGKELECGGWDHWVKALEYAAQVFGHGRVRSNIVAGIEPKQSILEGVEYLASKGVVCFAGAWNPNPGSAFEGHRSPEPSWHFDLARKITAIFRRAGFTYDQLYDCAASPTTLCHDIYKIEDEALPAFQQKAG